jgi:hypothetical protein
MSKWFFAGLSVLLLMACVHERYAELDPSRRIDAVAGVSVLPPQEQGWMMPQMSQYRLGLFKQDSQPDATSSAQVRIFQLPKIESEEQFLQYVTRHRSTEPAGKFKVLENVAEVSRGSDGYCVRYHSVSEDKVANTPSGSKEIIIETIGYFCQHPKRENVGVLFEYSYRHHPGDEDAKFVQKANSFLDQVRFTDF